MAKRNETDFTYVDTVYVPNRSVNICTCMVIGLNLNNNIPLQDQSDYTSVLAALDVLEANGYELVFFTYM